MLRGKVFDNSMVTGMQSSPSITHGLPHPSMGMVLRLAYMAVNGHLTSGSPITFSTGERFVRGYMGLDCVRSGVGLDWGIITHQNPHLANFLDTDDVCLTRSCNLHNKSPPVFQLWNPQVTALLNHYKSTTPPAHSRRGSGTRSTLSSSIHKRIGVSWDFGIDVLKCGTSVYMEPWVMKH